MESGWNMRDVERRRSSWRVRALAPALVASALLLGACGQGNSAGGPGGGGSQGPVTVGYVVVQPSSVPIEQELPGRVAAYQISEVRPQVSGVILRRLFRKARSSARARRSTRSTRASIRRRSAQAAANLQSARASADAARARAARYEPLAEMEAVSKQDYTDALAQARQAEAAIAQNSAAAADCPDQPALHPRARADQRPHRPVERHRGRAGHRQPGRTADHHHPARPGLCRHPAVGARPARAAPVAGAGRHRADRRAGAAASCPTAATMATPARSSSAEVVVNPDTGTVTLRARFPNPQSHPAARHVRHRRSSPRRSTPPPSWCRSRRSLAIPRAMRRCGSSGPATRAVQRTVVADRTQGPYWVVTQGLAAGEKVITQGTANLRDGRQDQAGPGQRPAAGPGPPPGARPTGRAVG